MPASVDALANERIRAVPRRLPRGRDVANLHKHPRPVGAQRPERADDLAVRLDLAVGRKQPDQRGAVLGDDGQRRLLPVRDAGVAGDETGADAEGFIATQQVAGLGEVAVELCQLG